MNKYYVRKLKLRSWVKDTLVIGALALIIVGGLIIASERFEKIDNGEITVVSESEMAERN